jgi:aldehyde:ferredoxin oxidoreductase
LLENNGAAILALYRSGHSWSSIARELSAATGERISADLLRAACVKRAPKRRANAAKDGAPKALKLAPRPLPTPQTPQTSEAERFGAKGLKL